MDKRKQPQKKQDYSVYLQTMITMKVHLKMSEVGSNTKSNLENLIVRKTAGKCIPEGYVRPDSIELITYSAGMVKMNMIEFQVVFKCNVCNPAEGMVVSCIVRTITKAGIHAEVITKNKENEFVCIPMKIFVARDHNATSRLFTEAKENDTIYVSIIGTRFELNDPHIVAIASIVHPPKEDTFGGGGGKKPILVGEEILNGGEDEADE
jgi:DNA-directed RNA polymerase subunit E'/Rpb7